RAEQHVLSPAGTQRRPELARLNPEQLHVRGERQPVPDAYEKAKGHWPGDRPLFRANQPTREKARSDCLSTPPVLGSESRAVGRVSRRPPTAPAVRLRAAQSHLAH